MTTHERWMEFALKEARTAFSKNEVPVGAVVVHGGDGHRKRIQSN